MPHVLIVEDHEENRDLLKMLLEVSGYRVTVAGDGLEALAAARRDRPDVVVSDVLMPKMDGFALCRAWMQDAALRPIPFIFYSATYVRVEDEQFAMAQGAVRYLIKPLEADVFLRELHAVLQQWSGRVSPGPQAPLDAVASHALHESALTRKLEDKIAQLELANRKLQESEARFRSLNEMSSDFYWETDAEHRMTQRASFGKKRSTVSEFEQGTYVGKYRWEIPNLSPDAAGWAAHRAMLDAHQPFRKFEISRPGTDGTERFISVSGDPVFDASGAFAGYRGVGTDVTERKRSEEGLKLFRALIDQSSDAIEVVDPDTLKFLDVNEKACLDLGYSREQMLALTVLDIDPTFDRTTAMAAVQGLKQSGSAVLEGRHRRRDGSEFQVEISLKYIRFDRDYVLSIARDITERKLADSKIHRLTQLYAALSQCNQAIVRSASEEELLPQICSAAVQLGGMKLAWIATVAEDGRTVSVAASAGDHADEYLRDIEISLDAGSPLGLGPTGTAIRENRPVWNQDWQHDPLAKPWQERRARLGLRSGGSLPLHRHGVPAGALCLYAGEIGAFDEAARNLLAEMATDIDFALENFAREAARQQVEKDHRAAEEKYRGLVEQSVAGVYMVQDGNFAYVNPRAAEIIGHGTADKVTGADPLQWIAETDRGRVAQNMRRVIEGEVEGIVMDFAAVRADGTTIQIGGNAARATHQGRPAIIGLIQDISEKKRADEQIQRYIEQLRTAFASTVEVATTLSEMRDPYTAGHERRVGNIAAAIGTELGMDAQRIEGLRVAGFLHDIGKITIPAEILSKPGRLSEIEYRLIKGHPQSGYDVLKAVKFPWPVAEIALQHHERMDGNGYPQGLKGEAILLEARIMAVADVMEAMSSHRPYRPGLGIDRALAEVERGLGTAYDADVAKACLRLFREGRYRLPA